MFPGPLPDFEQILREIERAGPASVDDVNRIIAEKVETYNTRPQEALGGLSPDQMHAILSGDWNTNGALRLNESLTIHDLEGAPILADARTLMGYVAANGAVKETSAGNLPRAVVAALLPRLRMTGHSPRDMLAPEPQPTNEGDVFWLQALRHTLLFARVLVRRKGLRVTRRGHELLEPDRAGELYALIFRTLFREVDLRFFSGDDGHQGLQPTIAYSFHRLRSLARDWTSAGELASGAWLEDAKDPPSDREQANVDFRHYAFRNRVLRPLSQFGLLEERQLPTEERWNRLVEFRVTALFDRFLTFDFGVASEDRGQRLP